MEDHKKENCTSYAILSFYQQTSPLMRAGSHQVIFRGSINQIIRNNSSFCVLILLRPSVCLCCLLCVSAHLMRISAQISAQNQQQNKFRFYFLQVTAPLLLSLVELIYGVCIWFQLHTLSIFTVDWMQKTPVFYVLS